MSTDLVIGTMYPEDNRWRLGDKIMSPHILRTIEQFPGLDLQHLKRVRFSDVPGQRVLECLRTIMNSESTLLQLEIDEIIVSEYTTFTFMYLHFLSIDSIVVIDSDGNKLPEGPANTMILFNSPVLRKVYLGK